MGQKAFLDFLNWGFWAADNQIRLLRSRMASLDGKSLRSFWTSWSHFLVFWSLDWAQLATSTTDRLTHSTTHTSSLSTTTPLIIFFKPNMRTRK